MPSANNMFLLIVIMFVGIAFLSYWGVSIIPQFTTFNDAIMEIVGSGFWTITAILGLIAVFKFGQDNKRFSSSELVYGLIAVGAIVFLYGGQTGMFQSLMTVNLPFLPEITLPFDVNTQTLMAKVAGMLTIAGGIALAPSVTKTGKKARKLLPF